MRRTQHERSIIIRFALVAAAAAAGGSPPRAVAADEAQALLARADAIRNPDRDFAITMTLAEYRTGKLVASSELAVYSKPAPDSGQYNNIVRHVAPKRDTGKLVLRNGVDLWFYDPASKASIRISPQARLLGQASNGDVMSTRLASYYAAQIAGRESVEDDSKTARRCVKLHLTAQRPEAPYRIVDYWVDEATARPLKAQFFTAEGRLLKTAFFRRYQAALGGERPTETAIVDGLDPAWITVMRTTGFRWREVPQTWLQREYLPSFTAAE
jgi:hypothetical protein